MDSDHIGEAEATMFAKFRDDQYFGSLTMNENEVQTLGHMFLIRDQADLLPSSETVEETFATHAVAIQHLEDLAKAVLRNGTEWRAEKKALKKAQAEEKKAGCLVEDCWFIVSQNTPVYFFDCLCWQAMEKELKKQEARRAKVEAQAEKERQKREQALKERTETDPNAKGKKRRAIGNMWSQLSDSDPEVIRSKFEDAHHKLEIFEPSDLDSWTCFFCDISQL